MLSLRGKVVLVTGATRGIGYATALAFASEGCKVIVGYRADHDTALKAVNECKRAGAVDAIPLKLDVTMNEEIDGAVKEVIDKYGYVDVLVNNAGVIRWKPLVEQSYEDIEVQVRTNLEGLIKVTRAFLPYVKECIVNIASGAGKTGYADLSTYCATKFGVRGFTQSLAKETGVKVYSVNPDATATRMTGFTGRDPKDVAKVIVNTVKGKYRLSSGSDVDVWRYV